MGRINSMISYKQIKSVASQVGFDLCGVARPRLFEQNREAYGRWIDAGYDSTLEYMRRNLDKRFDVSALVEGAQSVVVCAVSYKSDINSFYQPHTQNKVASYACCRDYHKTIKKMLLQMLSRLQQEYSQLQGRAFVDTAPLLEKQMAVEAGLGWIGRQSLLVTPRFGSYVLLGELVLNLAVDSYDEPYSGVGCGECRRCLQACPTGALVEDMVVDTSRCISCHTIEAESHNRLDLSGWIFGCDECQMCCPYNKQAESHHFAAFNPLFDPMAISTQQWLAMDEEEFAERFSSTPLKRSGLERIKRNVCGGVKVDCYADSSADDTDE